MHEKIANISTDDPIVSLRLPRTVPPTLLKISVYRQKVIPLFYLITMRLVADTFDGYPPLSQPSQLGGTTVRGIGVLVHESSSL